MGVIDTEETAKQLLTKGLLLQRVTMIPLNKIKKRTCSKEKICLVKNYHQNNATFALQLIEYSNTVANAIEYTFGGAFVCKDINTAKKIAFGQVKVRAVTTDGDDFNPGGFITGGSRNLTGSVLKKLSEFRELENKITEHSSKLNEIESRLQSLLNTNKKHTELNNKLEIKKNYIVMLEDKLKTSEESQKAELVKQFEKAFDDSSFIHGTFINKQYEIKNKITSLEHTLNNWELNCSKKF